MNRKITRREFLATTSATTTAGCSRQLRQQSKNPAEIHPSGSWQSYQSNSQNNASLQNSISSKPEGIIWTHKFDLSVTGQPVHDGKRIIVGSPSGTVKAIRIQDGKLLWKVNLNDSVYKSLALVDGTIIVPADDNFYGIDVQDGTQIWTYPVEGEPTAPTVSSEGVICPSSGADDTPLLDSRTGEVVQKIGFGNQQFPIPLIDGQVAIFHTDGSISAYDLAEGRTLWEYSTRYPVINPISFHEYLYLPLVNGGIEVVSKEGNSEHLFNLGGSETFTPVVTNQFLYATTAEGKLHMHNIISGESKIKSTEPFYPRDQGVSELVNSAPTVNENVIFCRGLGGSTYVFVRKSRRGKVERYSWNSGFHTTMSPIISGNVVFFLGKKISALVVNTQ